MSLQNSIEGLIQRAEAAAEHENEYLADDGLLHCMKCGDALQTVINIFGQERTVRCVCRCVMAKREVWEKQQYADKIATRRQICFRGTNMAGWNFDVDNGQRPAMSAYMRKYADKFDEYVRSGRGLILYGDVGTGKSFYAACIANKVIDKGYRAIMKNFAQIANELGGTWEKQEYIESLVSYDLLIIDDLGAERTGDYMQEIVYNVIDARSRTGLPLIVTTNLTPDELSKSAEIGRDRIYDRLLERCLAVGITGKSQRRKIASQVWREMREQLGMEVTQNE